MAQRITDIDQVREYIELYGHFPDEIHLPAKEDEDPEIIELDVCHGTVPSGCQRHQFSPEEREEEILRRIETMRSLLTKLRQYRKDHGV